jgi:hypothetical protein
MKRIQMRIEMMRLDAAYDSRCAMLISKAGASDAHREDAVAMRGAL